MKKIDIIEKYAKSNNVTKKEATTAVESVIDIIKNGIIDDGEVNILGFVKFEKVHKAATTARNVRTGETVAVPEKDVPKAKFAKVFKEAVNG